MTDEDILKELDFHVEEPEDVPDFAQMGDYELSQFISELQVKLKNEDMDSQSKNETHALLAPAIYEFRHRRK